MSQKTELLGRKIQSTRKVKLSLADDKENTRISGCVFMSNGYLVACDQSNCKIKLLDRSLSLQESLKLPSKPSDISVMDDDTVIVALPYQEQLQYVQVFPQLILLDHAIKLDKQCWGVRVSGQKIYVSCHTAKKDGEVRVLDKLGDLKRRLEIKEDGSNLFYSPYYITVSPAADKIFVSDWDRQIVTCMKVDGSIVYQYKKAAVHTPGGLYCDDGDNIMVCGYYSNNIHMISTDGEKYVPLLSSDDGLVRPGSVAYRKSDDTLVVCCHGSNMVVYQLSK